MDFTQQLHGVRQANFSARAGHYHEEEDGRRAHVRSSFPERFPAESCGAACG